ncbi:relaxase [Salmonella enterica subsp. enterica serovar Java]|nr:relaxase [Salmonella enterica subsp. enterica serovar Java]MDM9043084.1 relaxase [Escherichia coli]
MAIVRVRGGNAGIAEYLREGQKQGRAFNRDELDLRVCLDGNLALTENIINAIPDKDQDRYLHITISFRENELPIETIENVVSEYKSLLLSAYTEEEFNFYAEAHLPKIKSITDRNTGEEKERKPHVHIVIPKQNLLTGGALDPVGLYSHHEKYHDAIQEKLNIKFGLESPKDFVRITDDNQSLILSRVKADTFKGYRADVKKDIYNLVHDENIKNYDSFILSLQGKYSEVRVRNKGKANEYLAVKTSADSNYINLKSPIFQRQYIQERRLEKPRLSSAQVERLIDDWKHRVSKEIKYVNKASKKFRQEYRAASFDEKKEIILNRERGFYETTGQRTNRTKSAQKSRNQNRFGRDTSDFTVGLPEMRSGDMVPDFDGYEYSIGERRFNASQSRQSNVLLREIPQASVDNGRAEESKHNGLRRGARGASYGLDSVTASIGTAYNDKKIASSEGELAEFKNIRLTLSGEHLLNRLSNTHGIDVSNYTVKQAKDGSARIGNGKVNLNVSDFLTKEMKFTWNEAKSYLRVAYDEQVSKEMAKAKVKIPKEIWQDFNVNYRPEYFGKIKELRKQINYNCKVMRYESKQAYWKERAEIFSRKMSYADRKAALSIAVFNKLRHDKEVRQYQYEQRNLLSRFEKVEPEFLITNYIQNKEGGYMARLTDMIEGVAEKNAFSSFEPEDAFTLKRHVNDVQQNEEFNEKRKRQLAFADLTPHKQENGDVKYKSSLLATAFVDKGNKIEFPTLINDKDKIALGLELAAEKYKGKIQLTGLPGFKEKAIEIAAERGLEVEFRPKKYQDRFEELKKQFAQERAERGGVNQEQSQKGDERKREEQPELSMTGFKAKDLPYNELTRDSVREMAKTLSENQVSFRELAETAKSSPDKSVGELIQEIANKPASERAATGLELNVTTHYDAESNRTKILVNDLPLDIYVQTASEIANTDPDVIRMPLLASEELSQLTPQQIEQGYAEGEVSIPSVTINENGRAINKDIRVEFEAMENDSTAYRVIVNGQPMKEVHKPEQGGNMEHYEKEMAIISNIKTVLEEKGISTMSYFSDAHNSPTAQIDRDIKKAETELAKEMIRNDHYVKSGNHETAKEHQKEVLDYLKDKIATAKEARENLLEASAKSASASEQKKDKEMVIVAAKPPKDFLMGGDGKAYTDSFVPKAFQATAPAKEKEKAAPEPTQKPKISIER